MGLTTASRARQVMADGKEVELPPSVQGIMFLNIGSWGGGVKLWHDEEGDKDGAVADFSVRTTPSAPLRTELSITVTDTTSPYSAACG